MNLKQFATVFSAAMFSLAALMVLERGGSGSDLVGETGASSALRDDSLVLDHP